MPTPTGVFPCYENQFKIGATGVTPPATPIANCEEFSVAFDNGIEEWNAFENEGWKSRLMTAKAITISVKAKRTRGDSGNDMVAGIAFVGGHSAEKNVLWTLPDGSTLLMTNAVISVTANSAGASTSVGALEFDIMSNGKPTFTAAG